MASSALANSLCIFLCICSLQAVVIQAGKAKPLHITFFVHEIRGGPNSTILAAAGPGAGNASIAPWGSFRVNDNLIKKGTASNSTVLGRSTGTAVVTTIGGIAAGGVQLAVQLIFSENSMYYGSSIAIVGTAGTPGATSFEVIAVGGTGFFRGYSGYAILAFLPAAAVPPLFVIRWDVYLSK